MSIFRNSFWVLVSMLAGRGTIIFSGIVIAHYVGSSAFSTFSFIHTTVASLSTIASVGMLNGVPRFFARLGADESSSAISRALLALAVAGLGLVTAAGIVALLPAGLIGLPDVTYEMHLAILIVTLGLSNLAIGATEGLEKFREVSMATAAMSFLMLSGVIVSVSIQDIGPAICTYIAGTLLVVVLLSPGAYLQIVRIARSSGISFSRADLKAVVGFSGPIFMSVILLNSGLWLVGRRLIELDASAVIYAEFVMGVQWFGLASMVSIVVGRVIVPRLTRSAALDERSAHSKSIFSGVKLAAFGSLAVFAGVCLFSSIIVGLYGEDFKDASKTLILFVGVAVISSPIAILSSDLIARGKSWFVFFVVLTWWASLMLFAYVPNTLSAYGAAQAVLYSYVIYLASAFAAMRLTTLKEGGVS